ncbi:hypothetical protein EVAR_12130_1 [Eumeta japonica]|uniref:Uncharacterized protein n=1 Tax=Eumeta variegata TaxID=151549 RepID=A0A4C1U5E9_EUMVA|nr:hypothetical protein EVAR_12130_1 [Eumeta japonica]
MCTLSARRLSPLPVPPAPKETCHSSKSRICMQHILNFCGVTGTVRRVLRIESYQRYYLRLKDRAETKDSAVSPFHEGRINLALFSTAIGIDVRLDYY